MHTPFDTKCSQLLQPKTIQMVNMNMCGMCECHSSGTTTKNNVHLSTRARRCCVKMNDINKLNEGGRHLQFSNNMITLRVAGASVTETNKHSGTKVDFIIIMYTMAQQICRYGFVFIANWLIYGNCLGSHEACAIYLHVCSCRLSEWFVRYEYWLAWLAHKVACIINQSKYLIGDDLNQRLRWLATWILIY